jgi:hypothetical protein
MYSSINLHNLQNSEFIQFIKNFLSILSKENPELLKVKTEFDKLSVDCANLYEFYKSQLGNKLTQLVYELDSQRDNALKGILAVLDGYVKHYDSELQTAAKLLLSSIDIYRDKYQKESVLLEKICLNWTMEDQYASALASLHLTKWTRKLNEINREFQTQHMVRLELDANAPELKILGHRKLCIDSYRKLIKHLEANEVIDGDEAYKTLTLKVNKLIEINNTLIENKLKKTDDTLVEES